jgi:hypothetical protein
MYNCAQKYITYYKIENESFEDILVEPLHFALNSKTATVNSNPTPSYISCNESFHTLTLPYKTPSFHFHFVSMASSNELSVSPSLPVADLTDSINRLNLIPPSDKDSDDAPPLSSPSSNGGYNNVSDDVINQVDQFLRDAIQNPRERLSSEFSPFNE